MGFVTLDSHCYTGAYHSWVTISFLNEVVTRADCCQLHAVLLTFFNHKLEFITGLTFKRSMLCKQETHTLIRDDLTAVLPNDLASHVPKVI